MTERDPFGRLPGEDPLAGLGSLSDSTTPQPAIEPTTAEPEVADDGGARDGWRRSEPTRGHDPASAARDEAAQTGSAQARAPRRSAGRGAIIAACVIAGLAVGANLFAGLPASSDDKRGVASSQPASPASASDGPTPVGLQPRSMLRRSNLAPALRRLRGSGLGRLRSLRIAPERIDAQLLTRGGRLRFVQLHHGGELRRLSLSGPGFGQIPTIPFAQVNAAAPARLARGAAQRTKRPASQVNYLVIATGATTQWSIFMRDGTHFLGDVRGTITRRIG